ncbi:hypothetical protein BBR47_09450 [Brevibacillus brevis NBRC 100599]|uniref:Uncharacterized protein n=1 Tax=Brevibacillus brevis (strain 47 / JCM 6285 / NBRC 100599) TaxID=358681 RepID=C0Z5W5_BREBN|nr:hypothetical protein BBR47_09450 [Brevibacillus brevis NBRC 100599]
MKSRSGVNVEDSECSVLTGYTEIAIFKLLGK